MVDCSALAICSRGTNRAGDKVGEKCRYLLKVVGTVQYSLL